MWDIYKTDEYKKTDVHYSKEEIEDAMNNTVQLHYATSTKPWKNVDSTKSEVWFEYLVKTNFLKEYLQKLPKQIVLPEERTQEIEQNSRERIENEVRETITEEVRKSCTLKAKINNRFGKYRVFRICKYILKNPLFLFKKSFYQKIYEKVDRKLDKQDFTLVIFDDAFPSIYSPFRYEEYMEYMKNFQNVYAYTTGTSLLALNEKRSVKEVIEEFEQINPEYKGKVFKLDYDNKKKLNEFRNKIAIITFLQNIQNPVYDNLELLEFYQIPFIFTLYPGGGFVLNDKESDEKLKRIFSSKYFRKVIVTQKITSDYLIKNNFCNEENIEFIYGIVTPENILNTKIDGKNYYKKGKDTMDLCFVAHKYCKKGLDKGYDLFIDLAKSMCKKYDNVRFHVIGGFTKDDIDVKEIEDKMNFYGILSSQELIELYKKMDIIVSPNRPFKLGEGSFDGFPTGACTEAMINGVALICTDELNMNIKFNNKQEIIIIKPEIKDLVNEVEELYNNPENIEKIAKAGRNKALEIYSKDAQIKPRINLIRKEAKKYYKY